MILACEHHLHLHSHLHALLASILPQGWGGAGFLFIEAHGFIPMCLVACLPCCLRQVLYRLCVQGGGVLSEEGYPICWG